jgi:hypothetical protein
VRQIVVERRKPDLEGDRHMAGRAVHPREGQHAAERFLVVVDRDVPLRRRHAEPGARHDVLVVLGDERRRVVARRVRDFEDLVGLELGQVEPGDARGVVAVDEEPAAVGHAGGLRELRVMGVVPRHLAVARGQHRLGLLAVAPAVLRVLGEDRDVLEQPAGRQAVHPDLAVEPAGHEGVELVVAAGWDVNLDRRVGGRTEPARVRSGTAGHGDRGAREQGESSQPVVSVRHPGRHGVILNRDAPNVAAGAGMEREAEVKGSSATTVAAPAER